MDGDGLEAPAEIFQIEAVDAGIDDMAAFAWDGPDDSDEEIAAMVPYKNEIEKKIGLKFSKRGLIEYIEK